MLKINDWFYQDLEETTSTNDAVIEFFKKTNAPSVVSSKTQTNGRGRLGRLWKQASGNLYSSFIYEIEPKDLSRFVMISGLAAAQTVASFLPHKKVQIKWPNDVLVDDKKICGILFEKGPLNYWVMGIGINVKQAPILDNPLYEATSLLDMGSSVTRNEVLQVLVQHFDALRAEYLQNGFARIKAELLDRAYNRGKKIYIKGVKNELEGIFEGIDDDGALVLKTKQETVRVIVGDVFEKETK